MAMTVDERRAAVIRFVTALKAADRTGIAAAVSPDVVWTIAGSSLVSGRFEGPGAVHALVRTLVDYGCRIAVQDVTYGGDGVTIVIRGTGSHDGRSIDVSAVNVLRFRDGVVCGVGTDFSDIRSVGAYFR